MKQLKEEKIYKKPQLNSDGAEIPDPRPVAIPVGFRRPETLAEQVRRLVKSERFAAEMNARGHDTFEEHDDFDVGDDYDPSSPYEESFEGSFDYKAEAVTTAPQPSADPTPKQEPQTEILTKKGSKKTTTTTVEED